MSDAAAPAVAGRTGLAVLMMLGAFVLFAGMDTTAKWLVTHGIPPMQVSFLRYLVHALLVLAWFLPRDGMALFRSRAPGREVLRGAVLLGSTLLNFTALIYLPLNVTTAVFFATPLVVCALSIPLLGERVGAAQWLAILGGFAGVLVITRPWAAGIHWAMLLCLAALVCAALYYIFTRSLAGVDSNATMQVWSAGLSSLVLLPVAAIDWVWTADPLLWGLMLFLGALGAVSHLIATAAHAMAAASTLAPTVYSQVLWITGLSFLLWGELPDAETIAGTAIIMASGLALWRIEARRG